MLTEFERVVLGKLLEGDHPVLATLREQLPTILVYTRDFSPVGVNTHFVVADRAPRTTPSGFDLTDVAFRFEGADQPGHAVLMVRDGVLHELMLYNWTDVWPARPDLRLEWIKYLAPNRDGETAQPSDERDLVGLADELAA